MKFGGLPLPGAAVTAKPANAKEGDKTFGAITDLDGRYSFPDLPDGDVDDSSRDAAVRAHAAGSDRRRRSRRDGLGSEAAPGRSDRRDRDAGSARLAGRRRLRLRLRSAAAPRTVATGKRLRRPPTPNGVSAHGPERGARPLRTTTLRAPAADNAAPQEASALSQRAADGLLINGSVNNGASSPFAQLQAFGNNRRGVRSLYNGSLGFSLDNSALDARSFSLTGQDTLKPAYSRMQGLAAFGGPVKIPGLIKRNGPNFTVNYQWLHNRNASTQRTGLMPTLAASGNFAALRHRATWHGAPFVGNIIPLTQISPQALALLSFYPLPNFDGSTRYNYQIPLVGGAASGQRAGAHEQAGQEESVLRHVRAAEHPHGQYESVRVSGYRQLARHEPAAELETFIHAASLRQLRSISSAGFRPPTFRFSRIARMSRARRGSPATIRSR